MVGEVVGTTLRRGLGSDAQSVQFIETNRERFDHLQPCPPQVGILRVLRIPQLSEAAVSDRIELDNRWKLDSWTQSHGTLHHPPRFDYSGLEVH